MRLRSENSNIFTITPYGVAHQLYAIYGDSVAGEWNAETALQSIAHSTLDGMPANINGCIDALNYLNQKLEAVRKTVSFWDAYQIIDVIDNKDNVLSKLTQLPNNSSLITNVKTPFSWTNPSTGLSDSIYSGDIFIKDYSGIIHLIHATNKGIYVPTEIKFVEGNSMMIEYEYATVGDNEVRIRTDEEQEFNIDADSGYNYHGVLGASGAENDNFIFTVLYSRGETASVTGPAIIPIVKFFTNGNQVFLPITVRGPETIYNPTTMRTEPCFKIINSTPVVLNYEVR